jgi:hypothetical protein
MNLSSCCLSPHLGSHVAAGGAGLLRAAAAPATDSQQLQALLRATAVPKALS